MSYARQTVWNKKLPSFIGFFVLLIALGITIVLSRNSLTFVSKATTGSEPKNLQLSNITSTSFTVSYTTDANALGTISYGKDLTTPNLALDDRDQQTNKPIEHNIHFITVKNLIPATLYYYVIESGTQKTDNNGTPFIVRTTATSVKNQPTGQSTLSGTVSLNDGSTPTEGLVYASVSGFQPLASLINPDGSYTVPLNQLQSTNAATATSLTSTTIVQLLAMTATQQSSVKLFVSQENNIPKIVLSQDYDFTLSTQPIASSSTQVASFSGFPTFSSSQPVSSPEIITPKDTQNFKDRQPLFQGRALPNTEVDITIQSQQEIATKIQSDNNGSWQFRPSQTLTPGKHIITIKSIDASGIIQTISRSFTVYAQGSHFTEPSVSPVAPSPTQTPIPSPTAALSPTSVPTPTALPTVATTPTPQPTTIPSRAPVPPTGSAAVMTVTIATLSILGVGALLFFLSAI